MLKFVSNDAVYLSFEMKCKADVTQIFIHCKSINCVINKFEIMLATQTAFFYNIVSLIITVCIL